MFELCALLKNNAPKVRKAPVSRAKAIKVGAVALLFGRTVVIAERDGRYANAWFVDMAGVRQSNSFSRDMLKVL